ncbi:MAG: hypothetical protein PHE02_15010, partial [Lachnospiraceae bacterium]|nr:hypothetical protein [Lachnospiraceae bacterium]
GTDEAGAEDAGTDETLGDEAGGVDDTAGLNALLNQVEDALADTGTTIDGTMSADDLLNNLLDSMGISFENADSKTQGAIILAMHKLAMHTNQTDFKKKAGSLATQAFNKGNPYLYQQYKDGNTEYVNTQSLSTCVGYRYIFNNSMKRLTLSRKGVYEEYTAFSDKVTYYDVEKKKEMQKTISKAAVYQKVIYLDEDYTTTQYSCYSFYITNCDYALLTTKELENAADEIYDTLLETLEAANADAA